MFKGGPSLKKLGMLEAPYVARHRRTVVASKIQDKANAAGLIRMNNMVTEEDGIENFRLKQLQTPDEIGPSINHTLTPASVTGQLGSTVYLHCVVHNRAQKTVTWLRRSDYHILTVGSLTYTSDERFSSSARTLQGKDTFTFPLAANRGSDSIVAATTTEHSAWHSPDRGTSSPDRTEDWMLQIRGVTIADAGEYECQINTQHPLISTHINLIVLAPHAQIVEAPELYVNSGSTIALTCVIHDCPQPLTHIFWYHQDKVRFRKRSAPLSWHQTWLEVWFLGIAINGSGHKYLACLFIWLLQSIPAGIRVLLLILALHPSMSMFYKASSRAELGARSSTAAKNAHLRPASKKSISSISGFSPVSKSAPGSSLDNPENHHTSAMQQGTRLTTTSILQFHMQSPGCTRQLQDTGCAATLLCLNGYHQRQCVNSDFV
ncbi:uncharacterized protein LOC111249659 isoform X2 [Varroa destructor]|uniref:Ig-like domain-containing protein n=1 Tax=Varroa destructor TaxID=109461 RepID=A0A7M7JZN1_VARDE|nr:uncharacterized protein LOC111249659 isoform X2 [Varroa destructor]